MVGIARAVLVYLLVLLIITGCGTGAGASRTGTTNPETDTASGGTEAPTPGTEATPRKTDGTTQMITFKTEPPDAVIVIDGKDKYTSPAEVCLTCNVEHSYEIAKDGYETTSGTISSVRDYKEKSRVPGKVGNFVVNMLAAAAMGALAGAAAAAGAPVVPLIIPNIKTGTGHPGYTSGPPRLEPDKIEVELTPESP
jgi:hypothetical protein